MEELQELSRYSNHCCYLTEKVFHIETCFKKKKKRWLSRYHFQENVSSQKILRYWKGFNGACNSVNTVSHTNVSLKGTEFILNTEESAILLELLSSRDNLRLFLRMRICVFPDLLKKPTALEDHFVIMQLSPPLVRLHCSKGDFCYRMKS